jgi:hypothetical protein
MGHCCSGPHNGSCSGSSTFWPLKKLAELATDLRGQGRQTTKHYPAGFSVFGLWNVWIGTPKRITYQKFAERVGKEGNGKEGRGKPSYPLPLPSLLGGPHARLCHQGQWPKTVEATILSYSWWSYIRNYHRTRSNKYMKCTRVNDSV